MTQMISITYSPSRTTNRATHSWLHYTMLAARNRQKLCVHAYSESPNTVWILRENRDCLKYFLPNAFGKGELHIAIVLGSSAHLSWL